MAAAITSPKGVMVAGVRFGSPPPGARRASEPGTMAQQHLARLTHGTSHGRELGESWVRGHSLPNYGATIPSGSLSAVLGDSSPAAWRAAAPSERSADQLLERMRLSTQPALDPQWLPPLERARQEAQQSALPDTGRAEFGSVLVQCSGAVLLGDEEHKALLGDLPPAGECSSYQFLSKLTTTEAKTLLRSKGIMLDDATVDEFIAVFDVDCSGVLSPTTLTALARVLEREQLRVSKTKSGRAVIEREHRRRVAEVRARRILDKNMEEKGALSQLSEEDRITVEEMARQKADDAARLAAAGAEHGADTALLRIVHSFEPEFRPGIRKVLPAILQAVVCPGYPEPAPLSPPHVEASVELGQSALNFFKAALGEREGQVLGMRCKEEGFESVDEILAAGLSEADLRELGLVQMKSRKRVLQLLAQLAQQPMGPSVNDSLLPRRDCCSNDAASSWSDDDRLPGNVSELDTEHEAALLSTATGDTEVASDFGAARWSERKALREGRGMVAGEEYSEEPSSLPQGEALSFMGKLGTARRERFLSKWRETETIAATYIQSVFRGRSCRAKIAKNVAKGLHPTAVSAYDFAVKSGLITESPGKHKQEAEHGHASIYKPNMVDRTTEVDIVQLQGAAWLDTMLGIQPAPEDQEPTPEPEPAPEAEAEPEQECEQSAYRYAKSEGLLGAGSERKKRHPSRWLRRKGAQRRVQPVEASIGQTNSPRRTEPQPPVEGSKRAKAYVWPEPELEMGTQATFRHVTSDLHYSVGRLLRLSKADFDVQRKDGGSSLNNDCKEAGYEPMRISFNHRQFCTIFSVHLVFLISGPLVGCPVAACALGKRGSQNMGLFPVCCPSDASERSAHYIRWVFVAQVAMWLLMAPTLTCAVLREVLEGSSHFSCQVPSTIELLLPAVLLSLHCSVACIKYGLMPVAEIAERTAQYRLPERLKAEQLWSWTFATGASTAVVQRELSLAMHRQGFTSPRHLRKTCLLFCPTVVTRNPTATTTKELNCMQQKQDEKNSDDQETMKVMEVAVEAVITRIVQFSLEAAPRDSFRGWLCSAVTLICFLFAGIPSLVRWATAPHPGLTAFDMVVVICSGLVSALMLGAQVAYMWMVFVDINRRRIRLEVLGYIFQLNGKRHGILRYNRFPLLLQDSAQNINAWMDARQLICGFGESFLCRIQVLICGWLVLSIVFLLAQIALVLYRPDSSVPSWMIMLCIYGAVHTCGLVFLIATAHQYNALTLEHQTAFSVARRRSLRDAWALEKEPADALKLARRLGVWIDKKASHEADLEEPEWRKDTRWQLLQAEKLYAAAGTELADSQQTGTAVRVCGTPVGAVIVGLVVASGLLSFVCSAVLLTGGASFAREQICVQPTVTCTWPVSLCSNTTTTIETSYTVATSPDNETSTNESAVGGAQLSSNFTEVELTFDLDPTSLNMTTFGDQVLSDLRSRLGAGPDDIELVSVRAGGVVVTVWVSAAAHAALMQAFRSGTLGSVAGNQVELVAPVLRANISQTWSFADSTSSSSSSSWAEDEFDPPCGGECPDGGQCVDNTCYSPLCFQNATVLIDLWRNPENAGNPPPYDSRFHVDANGTDSVAFVYHSLANYSLVTFAVLNESEFQDAAPEPELPGCGRGTTTIGGAAPDGSLCTFPFHYNGETFNECTDRDNNGTLWCNVIAQDGTLSWGNCDVGRCNELVDWPVVPDVYCALAAYVGSFHTHLEAERACTQEAGCFGVYDHLCDGLATAAEWRGGFHLCSTPAHELRSSSTGGCVYQRFIPPPLPTTIGAELPAGTLPAAIPLAPPAVDKACGTWFAGWVSSYEYRYQLANATRWGGSWDFQPDEYESGDIAQPYAASAVPPDTFVGMGAFPRPEEYTQQRVVCFAAGVLRTCAYSVAVSVTSCPNDVRYTLPPAPLAGFHGGGYCADAIHDTPCGPTPAGRLTVDGVCRNGGAWSGMLCPLSCPEDHHWSLSGGNDYNSMSSVEVRCVDGVWRSTVDHDASVPQCVPNPCEHEPTFIPHVSGRRSQCTGTPSGQSCSFQCTQGYIPSTTVTCHHGDWTLADAAATGGGCRADNTTGFVGPGERGMKWFEILGYVGDRTPLLPLLLVLGIFVLAGLSWMLRWLCRWQRAQVEAERARSCRPIDSVGHKFTVGAKRFGSLPPIITDPKERLESRNLATYALPRGVPGAIGGGEPLPGQGRRLPHAGDSLTPSHQVLPDTDWVPPAEEPSKWLSGGDGSSNAPLHVPDAPTTTPRSTSAEALQKTVFAAT